MPQAEIDQLLIAKARDGRTVVRLKGGDPFIFGRGGEEAQALAAAGVPFEIVPGVSSAYAAPAYAGIPVTHREHAAAFTVATGHEDPNKPASTLDWAKLADPNRTLVLLMATANLAEIANALMANGLAPATPVAVVQDGTRPTQRTVCGRLDSIAGEVARAGLGPPAVVVVGPVAALREELRWFDRSPLFGKHVLITRAGPQSAEFARALLGRGAQPIFAPTITIEPVTEAASADAAIGELPACAWLIFTSQNGVDAFFALLGARGLDARTIGATKVAAIGERTAARLLARGINADLVPETYVSEELARELIARSQSGDRVLLYRAQEARDALPEMLRDAGRDVTIIAAYRTLTPRDPAFAQKVASADILTFTSASTVRGFISLLDGVAPADAAKSKRVACIGPITANAATQAGLRVDVVAPVYTTAGLLAALERSYTAPQ
jgi:uroporphyrinogen III methyltransferase / synthase